MDHNHVHHFSYCQFGIWGVSRISLFSDNPKYHMRVSGNGATPTTGWFSSLKTPVDLGYPYFRKPPYIGYILYITLTINRFGEQK